MDMIAHLCTASAFSIVFGIVVRDWPSSGAAYRDRNWFDEFR